MSLYPLADQLSEIITASYVRWLLDESSGNRAELGGGTALSNTTTVGSVSPGFNSLDNAQYDNAADFVPTDRLTQGDNSGNDLTSDFTIMFFFKVDVANTNSRMFVHKWNQDANGAAYRIYHNGTQLNFSVSPNGNSSGQVTLSVNSAYSAGTWYHLIATYDPSTRMELYLNGSSIGQTTSSIPSSCFNSGRNLEIGGSDLDANWSLDGKMNDLILVKGQSVSDTEAANLYTIFQTVPSTFSPKVAIFSALEKMRSARDMVKRDSGLLVPKQGLILA